MSAPDWVEVADEPNHKEIFKNEQIRLYVAVIRPGEETAYHRHDKDTLYLVLVGGKNYSTTLAGSKGGKYVFPNSISLKRKIKWMLTRSIYGWTYLPKSIYFLMHNQGDPVIHKVRGSQDNERDMELMGIEFLNPGGSHRPLPIGLKSLKADHEDDTVHLFCVRFPSDLSKIGESVRFCGIVIVLKGAVRIETSPYVDSEIGVHDLGEGDFLWNDGGTRFTFSTPERTESEALLILMK